MSDIRYKRVLLKLSGEALMGDGHYGIDPKITDHLAKQVKELLAVGFIVTLPGEYAPGETLTVDVQQEPEDGVATGHLNKEELEAMPKAQLLTLAENMGLDTKDLTKAKLVEAIAAAEVQAEV